jgi:hypothetical protein
MACLYFIVASSALMMPILDVPMDLSSTGGQLFIVTPDVVPVDYPRTPAGNPDWLTMCQNPRPHQFQAALLTTPPPAPIFTDYRSMTNYWNRFPLIHLIIFLVHHLQQSNHDLDTWSNCFLQCLGSSYLPNPNTFTRLESGFIVSYPRIMTCLITSSFPDYLWQHVLRLITESHWTRYFDILNPGFRSMIDLANCPAISQRHILMYDGRCASIVCTQFNPPTGLFTYWSVLHVFIRCNFIKEATFVIKCKPDCIIWPSEMRLISRLADQDNPETAHVFTVSTHQSFQCTTLGAVIKRIIHLTTAKLSQNPSNTTCMEYISERLLYQVCV